jgi:hypothetical protein
VFDIQFESIKNKITCGLDEFGWLIKRIWSNLNQYNMNWYFDVQFWYRCLSKFIWFWSIAKPTCLRSSCISIINLFQENSSSSPPRFFYILKNSILSLKKNSICRNRNFSISNFRKISVFRNRSWISRQKKFRFIKIKFFMKGKIVNSGGEKET